MHYTYNSLIHNSKLATIPVASASWQKKMDTISIISLFSLCFVPLTLTCQALLLYETKLIGLYLHLYIARKMNAE